MQILQWLFRTPHGVCEKDGALITRCRRERQNDEQTKSEDLVVYSDGAAASRGASSEELEGDEDRTLTVVLSGDYSGTRFYGTLQLKHLRSILYWCNSSPWRCEGNSYHVVPRMGHKAPQSSVCSSTSANVGCKVLPICDGAAPSTSSSNAGCSSSGFLSDGLDKDSAQRSERRKAVSRVKELLRWAATAKTPHRVASKGWKSMYFRSNVGPKGGGGGGDHLDDSISVAASSKIKFRWNAGGRCSTMSSSACSPLTTSGKAKNNLSRLSSTSQCNAGLDHNALGSPKSEDYVRNGQWITTDADFVVLEL